MTNITELVLQLEEDEDGETFVIVLNESVREQELYCDPDLEDPWGGCPIAAGDINSVYYETGSTYFDFEGSGGNWAGKGIKFLGDNCVVTDNICVEIIDRGYESLQGLLGDWGYLIISESGVLASTSQTCSGNNWFYVYDSVDCS